MHVDSIPCCSNNAVLHERITWKKASFDFPTKCKKKTKTKKESGELQRSYPVVPLSVNAHTGLANVEIDERRTVAGVEGGRFSRGLSIPDMRLRVGHPVEATEGFGGFAYQIPVYWIEDAYCYDSRYWTSTLLVSVDRRFLPGCAGVAFAA